MVFYATSNGFDAKSLDGSTAAATTRVDPERAVRATEASRTQGPTMKVGAPTPEAFSNDALKTEVSMTEASPHGT